VDEVTGGFGARVWACGAKYLRGEVGVEAVGERSALLCAAVGGRWAVAAGGLQVGTLTAAPGEDTD